MQEEKVGEIIKCLNTLLCEEISAQVLYTKLEGVLERIEKMELSIEVTEPTPLFAFFEWNNGIITAHLYKRINHLLIKNLIEKHNMRKRNHG